MKKVNPEKALEKITIGALLVIVLTVLGFYNLVTLEREITKEEYHDLLSISLEYPDLQEDISNKTNSNGKCTKREYIEITDKIKAIKEKKEEKIVHGIKNMLTDT